MSLIEAENLNITHIYKKPRAAYKTVDDVSFVIDEGDVVGFVGPGGSGIEDVLDAIAGKEDEEIVGTLKVGAKVGYVDFKEDMSYTCDKYIKEHFKNGYDRAKFLEAARICQVDDYIPRTWNQLSIHQKVRMLIAIHLGAGAKIIILRNIDPLTIKPFLKEYIAILRNQNATVLCDLNSLPQGIEAVESVMVMKLGKIVQYDLLEDIKKTKDEFVRGFFDNHWVKL